MKSKAKPRTQTFETPPRFDRVETDFEQRPKETSQAREVFRFLDLLLEGGFLFKKLENIFPLKYRVLTWKLFAPRANKTRVGFSLLTLAFILSLINFSIVRAAAGNVNFKIVANGKTLFDQSVNINSSCDIRDDTGALLNYRSSYAICTLDQITSDYRVHFDEGNGLYLESLFGVDETPGCPDDKCWLYDINGQLAPLGVDNFILQPGQSVLFRFGNAPAIPAPNPPPESQPVKASNTTAPSVHAPAAPLASDQPPVSVPAVTIAPTISALPQTNRVASSTSEGCAISFAWAQYKGTPGISFGTWDGAYYAFVFPAGQSRDQAIWKAKTEGTSAKAGGLQPGVSYEGEVFINGAFLSGARPFWAKLAPTTCRLPQTNSNIGSIQSVNTTQQASEPTPTSSRSQTTSTTQAVKNTPEVTNRTITDDSVKKALNFLKAKKGSDGLIEAVGTSGWAALAFAAAGESDTDLVSAIGKKSGFAKATDVERTILVSTAAGIDTRNFFGSNLVEKLKSFVVEGQIGEKSSLNDDIFGILALVAADERGDLLSNELNYLNKNQNSEGGWGFQVGANSDVDTTAAAVQAFVASQELGFSNEANISKAIAYLKKAQNADGGFPFNTINLKNSNAASTAWAVQALATRKEDNTKAINYLKSLQESSGGFKTSQNGPVSSLVTSYSVLAILQKSLPIKTRVLGATTSLPDTGFETNLLLGVSLLLIPSGFLLFLQTGKDLAQKRLVHGYEDFYMMFNRRRKRRH